MPDRRWRKVFRDVWEHKARTLLVVVAMAVGLAGSGIVLNAWALVQRATEEGFVASDPAGATLRADVITPDLVSLARTIPGVRDAQARRRVTALVQVQGAWRTALLFVSDDPSARRIGKLRPEAGAWPAAGEFAVERSSVAYSGLGVGDSVVLNLGPEKLVPLPITGIVRDVGLAPGWMEHVVYGVISTATLERLGLTPQLNELQLVVADPRATQDGVRRIAWRVKGALEAAGHPVSDVEVPVPGEHIHAAQMDSLLYTQGAFGILALVVCAFLVVNLMAATLAGQVREIGIMKTLGAERDQLSAMYLALAAGIGLAAAVIALPVAVTLGRSYATLKADLLNFDVTLYAIPAWAIALQVVVALVVPVLAAAIPVRAATRMPVASALRDVGIAADGRQPSEPWMARRGGLSRVMLLSIRNAFRKRQRMLLTLLAMASGGAVFLGARNLRQSVIGSLDLVFGAQRYDVSLRLAGPQPPRAAEAVAAGVEGVRAVEGWAGGRGNVLHADSTAGNTFAIAAPPLGSQLMAPEVYQGRWVNASDTAALVVSRSLLAAEPSVTLGGAMTAAVGEHVVTWTVVGVVDGLPSPTAWTSRETMQRLHADSAVTSLVVSVVPQDLASRVDVIQRLRTALDVAGMPVASSQLLAENRRVLEDHLLMVVDFLAAMAWIMVAVGGMGLASTMGLAVLERTREIGVMRAMGARHRSLLTMIEVEGLVIAVLSWAIALPLSVPMSALLGFAFGRVMFRVPLTLLPEGGGVWRWLVVVVGLSLVACAWPALRATRGTISRALAYE